MAPRGAASRRVPAGSLKRSKQALPEVKQRKHELR